MPLHSSVCERLAHIHKQLPFLALLLWIELKGVNVGCGMRGFEGLLEVVQSHTQPYKIVSCKARSASARSTSLLWLSPEPQRSCAITGCTHTNPWQQASSAGKEVGGVGSTENLTDLQWQGKSVKLCTAEVLKSREVLNPD